MAKTSIKFYPSLDRKNKKNGKIPFYLRVCSDGKKAEYRLPIEFSESDLIYWSDITQRCLLKDANINRFLNKYEKEYEDLKYSLGYKINTVPPNEIIDKITGRSSQKGNSMVEFFNDVYNEITMKDHEKTSGTKGNYYKALNHLNHFMVASNQVQLQFADIKRDFAESFWEYLLSENIEKKKKRIAPVSARGYTKKIKTYFSIAMRKGKIERNPFDGFKMKGRSPQKEKLTSIHIKRLFTENWNSFTKLEKVVDLFKFCILTGLSGGDALLLKEENLQHFTEDKVFLVGKRCKTGQEYRQFLVSDAIHIIKKYKLDPLVQNSPYLLPQITNQESNKRLKIIAVKIEVPFNCTTHTGRHSFRVMLNEARIADYAVRKLMMGQSAFRDVDGIYNEIREFQLLEARDLIQQYLNQLFSQNGN